MASYADRTGEGKLSCRLCQHITHKTYNMRVHLEGKHDLSAGYTCDICSVVKKTKHLLHMHRLQCGQQTSQY